MQTRLFIVILVLQSERPMRVLIDTLILFQMTPAGIVAEPQELAVLIGHLSWDADLVAVEVVRLLSVFVVCGCLIADLRQGVVRTAHTLRQGWRFHGGYGLL